MVSKPIIKSTINMKKLFSGIYMLAFALLATTFSSCESGDKDDDDNNNASDLFADYFDNMGSYPDAVNATWVDKEGQTVTMQAYPGQIVLFTRGASAAGIKTLVTDNQGTIALQIPNAGFYVAAINREQTQEFLTAMYASALISDAFPNTPSYPKINSNRHSYWQAYVKGPSSVISTDGMTPVAGTYKSIRNDGDAGSIIQTVDVAVSVDCGNVTHKDGVAAIARNTGIQAHINDVSVDPKTKNTDFVMPYKKTAELLDYAYKHNLPVVINLSLGGNDSKPGSNYHFMRDMGLLLENMLQHNPHILDNAVIYMSATNNHTDETEDFTYLTDVDFPDSPIWDHLYFVGAQEGANVCGLGTDPGNGWADFGIPNYVAAPSCNIQIPGTECYGTGNSLAAPVISALAAETYEILKEMGQTFTLPEVAHQLAVYQGMHAGTLPGAQELANLMAGIVPEVSYDGTWSGTFNYTATIYHDNDPPEIINTSFILTMTLKSKVAIPGYPHIMKITGVTCSDPTFGATMVVLPDTTLSMAMLPKEYGMASESGFGIMIKFPNDAFIGTNNSVNGTFTISADGNTLKSTPLVEDGVYMATTNIGTSNDPGSGPGGYAYNWCTFRNWTLTRQLR